MEILFYTLLILQIVYIFILSNEEAKIKFRGIESGFTIKYVGLRWKLVNVNLVLFCLLVWKFKDITSISSIYYIIFMFMNLTIINALIKFYHLNKSLKK